MNIVQMRFYGIHTGFVKSIATSFAESICKLRRHTFDDAGVYSWNTMLDTYGSGNAFNAETNPSK